MSLGQFAYASNSVSFLAATKLGNQPFAVAGGRLTAPSPAGRARVTARRKSAAPA